MLKYIALSLIFVVSTLAAKIVGGGGADIKQHPYQVSVQLRQDGSYYYRHQCGGSIIKANCILTAAHCVEFYRADDFMIVAGTSDLNDPNAVKKCVRQIYQHEKFNSSTYENDVALMYLSDDLPLNHVTIAPIVLATQAPEPGSLASVTGWGATSFGGARSNILLQVNVPIVNNDRCDAAYTPIYGHNSVRSDMICAGYLGIGGQDTCKGDSGGPFTFNKTLAGVVSWGFECARPDVPSVYANVAYFYNWIIYNS